MEPWLQMDCPTLFKIQMIRNKLHILFYEHYICVHVLSYMNAHLFPLKNTISSSQTPKCQFTQILTPFPIFYLQNFIPPPPFLASIHLDSTHNTDLIISWSSWWSFSAWGFSWTEWCRALGRTWPGGRRSVTRGCSLQPQSCYRSPEEQRNVC